MYTNQKTHYPKGLARTSAGTRFSVAAAPLLRRRSAASRKPVEDMREENDDLSTLLESGGTARSVALAYLPPYPSAKRYPAVRYPRMPSLTGGIPADARLLIRAYKALVLHRYGVKPRAGKKIYYRMKTAAEAMRKHGVRSPFAWASFRFVCWSLSENSADRPGIDYVFSAKVVERHLEQFNRKRSTYDVLNRVEITPSHARLLELWESARCVSACPRAGETGEEAARRVVAKILPMSTYRELASKISEERAGIEADLYRRLAQGEWIW